MLYCCKKCTVRLYHVPPLEACCVKGYEHCPFFFQIWVFSSIDACTIDCEAHVVTVPLLLCTPSSAALCNCFMRCNCNCFPGICFVVLSFCKLCKWCLAPEWPFCLHHWVLYCMLPRKAHVKVMPRGWIVIVNCQFVARVASPRATHKWAKSSHYTGLQLHTHPFARTALYARTVQGRGSPAPATQHEPPMHALVYF